MAFMNITNGRKTFNVSSGAYEEIYKGLGFRPVDEAEEEPKQTQPDPEETHTEDVVDETEDTGDDAGDDAGSEDEGGEEFDVDGLLEKPLSQWTPDELKQFTAIKGIDTTGASKVKDVRNIVKQFLENEAKNG